MRQTEVLSLMRENVAYKLQHGKAKEAVDMLEKLHKYVGTFRVVSTHWSIISETVLNFFFHFLRN